MKPCPRCQEPNADDAKACRACSASFIDPFASIDPGSGGINVPGLSLSLPPWVNQRRWLLACLGVAILFSAISSFVAGNAIKREPPRVVVLTNWLAKGQHFVTFRVEPPEADVRYSDLVEGAYDQNSQPETVRFVDDFIPSSRKPNQTNFSLRFTAYPNPVSLVGMAYTPGSYTVAFTPSEHSHKVRVGAAFGKSGFGDYFGRVRNAWDAKSLTMLRVKSHQNTFYVAVGPFTNTIFPPTLTLKTKPSPSAAPTATVSPLLSVTALVSTNIPSASALLQATNAPSN